MTRGEMRVLREARLRILNSLPRQHKDYFFEEVRKLCATHIASLGLPMSDRKSETLELLSEVMAKLLGVASLPADREAGGDAALADGEESEAKEPHDEDKALGASLELPGNWDKLDPKRDQRVTWLIEQIGGPRALAHRYEDMRRQRWGRWGQPGYRNVQISALASETGAEAESEEETLGRYADRSYPLREEQEDPHHAGEIQRAWHGLLAIAERQFKPDDDVSRLLRLLAQDADVQAGFGSAWPVRTIVEALNRRHPAPAWDDDRVDNAKKRLKNWIVRMKREQNLDSIDLMSLFVRVAREREVQPSAAATGERS